ncbi:TetR/AcrR family transcriptional regulator [Paraburkholderia caffeinilytica]|uniref:TetR/AcrR family transcriptional regulator n=1 Tax=Paraburkholderia caffeinilytica TaxID=1761016 RepID=UPI0038B9EE6D
MTDREEIEQLASGIPATKKVTTRRKSSDGTRKIILDAALEVFSEKGYDGARVDEIALRTGLNKNVLYHHFGNKDELFKAVLEHMYQVIRERQNDLQSRDLDPVSGMRKLVMFTGRIWVQHPQFLRLLHSENLLEGRHVKQSDVIYNMYSPLTATINDLLTRGQAAGVFRDNIDPVDLYISISALTAHYISNRYTFEGIFKMSLMSPQRIKHRLEHAADMILRFLLVDPAGHDGSKGC